MRLYIALILAYWLAFTGLQIGHAQDPPEGTPTVWQGSTDGGPVTPLPPY